MLKSKWLQNATIGGYLVAALLLPVLLHAEDQNKQSGSAQQTVAGQNPSIPALPSSDEPRGGESAKADWKNPECTNPKSHDEADLCEQIGMAKSANESVYLSEVQIFLGVFGAIGLFWTLWLTRQSNRAAIRAAEATEKTVEVTRIIGEAQTRAYISVSNAVIEIRPGTNHPNLRYKVRNFGNSPARKLTATYRAAYNRNNGTLRVYPKIARAYNGGFTIDIPAGADGTYGHVFEEFPMEAEDTEAMQAGYGLSFEVVANIEFEDVFKTKITETVRFVTIPSATGKLGPTIQTTSPLGFEGWEPGQSDAKPK